MALRWCSHLLLPLFLAVSLFFCRCADAADGRSVFQQKVTQSNSLFNMYHTHPLYANATVCKGFDSDFIISYQISPRETYRRLKKKFGGRNCTHISGNLIISHLDEFDGKLPDLSFLESIEEVSGYVMIFAVLLPRIAFPNLRIIRGVTAYPFRGHNCSLAVIHNHNGSLKSKFLRDLDLRSLRSVSYNDVYFDSNIGLCLAPFTINWDDILENPKKQTAVVPNAKLSRIQMGLCSNYVQSLGLKSPWSDLIKKRRSGSENNQSLCHERCPSYNGVRYCWTRDIATCQTLHKCQDNSCSRCFRKNGREQCCHPECIVGCHGPLPTQCVACRNFIDDKKCRNHCPSENAYDPLTHTPKFNPKARLYLGSMCVKSCTAGFVRLRNLCIESCPTGTYITKNNTCVPCGQKCSKVCNIAELEKQIMKEKGYSEDVVASFTLRSVLKLLKNCTRVRGKISVNSLSIYDAHQPEISKKESVKSADLWNLANIQEFSDGEIKLNLKNYTDVKNFTFLGNLTTMRNAKLLIANSRARFTGWLKLRNLIDSKVILIRNWRLCYMAGLKRLLTRFRWSLLLRPKKPPSICARQKLKCHRACHPKRGCVGPGPTFCYDCRRFRAGPACVMSCNDIPGFFATPAVLNVTARDLTEPSNVSCGSCHPLCRASCTGPNNSQCTGGCLTLQEANGACVDRCPRSSYANASLQRCLACPKACEPQLPVPSHSAMSVCSGPLSRPGRGGCNFCSYLFIDADDTPGQCLTHCPDGTYTKPLFAADIRNPRMAPIKQFVVATYTSACRPCHPECETCWGPGPDDCERCRRFRYRNKCVAECPEDEAFVESRNSTTGTALASNVSLTTTPSSPDLNETLCRPCHELCRKGCWGPSPEECIACKLFRIPGAVAGRFLCAEQCPEDQPYEFSHIDSGDTACYAEPQAHLQRTGYWRRIRIYIVVGVVLFIVAVVACIAGILLLRQRAVAKKETVRLQAKYTGALPEEEMEPLNPSHTQPNFTHLRIVNERELRRGQVIGSGAFGTVYKAEWLPPRGRNDVHQVSIPVAIKVLTDSSDAAENKELLEEARVMASVENPYCMRLIGVCMTAQLQLISQFMPLGSLLEYLRSNSSSIGAKELLTWSAQIAKGMQYLESRSIIHRDLAARNVLVQEPNHVRITDFGLAKLLDTNEEEYRATGGKMPVKWLALECIRHRRFTHKSDVWAYGVTLWELFTFGARPYADLQVAHVCNFLDSGERLRQPDICTLDVYMLMIKCWMVDEDSRPNFAELAEEVSKMARDPSRYLVVKLDAGRQDWDLPRCLDVSYYSEMVDQLCGESSPRYCRDELTLRIRPPAAAETDANLYTPCGAVPSAPAAWDEYNFQVDELACRTRPSQTLPIAPPNDPRFGVLGPAARADETEEEGGTEEPETEEELDDGGHPRGVGEDAEEEYTTPSAEPAAFCRPVRPLKTTGAEPMSPLVAATPPHAVGATGGRRLAGEVNRGAALPPPSADRKYGHLEAELAKQRAPGATRWDRPRYATDPLDSPDATIPIFRHQTMEMAPLPDKKQVVDLPWKRRSQVEDDDDYLQPRTFVDRSREPSPMSQCDIHPPSPALRLPVTSPRVPPPQVLNPDYFDASDPSNYYNEAAVSNRHFV